MTTLAERTEADILEAAADRIERDGWTTGNKGMLACEGPKCIEGAIAAEIGIVGRSSYFGDLYDYNELEGTSVWAALKSYLHRRPFLWNDDSRRTKEEVVAALRGAAAEARETEQL